MNNFKTFLGNLVGSCDNIFGALIMDFDGIAISRYFNPDLPKSPEVYEALIAEFGPLLKQFYKKADEMHLGETRNITIEVDSVNILFKFLTENNFLAVISSRDALLGKIDYYSTLEARRFKEAFNV